MSTKNRLGTISLCAAIAGMAALETALALDFIDGALWRILATGFEAATAGAVADWFAVSALFHHIPIPFLGRHTNILVKNRARFSAGIVDMIENKWLAPASVRQKLAGFSAASELLRLLETSRRRQFVLDALRDVLAQFAVGLDSIEVARFLERLLKNQLRSVEIAPVLGRWFGQTIQRGGQHALWDVLLATFERTIEEGKMNSIARDLIEQAIERYGSEGLLKRVGIGFAKKAGLLDYDSAVTRIVGEISGIVGKARGDAEHPLRGELDRILLHLADALTSGDPATIEAVESLKARIIENTDAAKLIHEMLANYKETVIAQLSDRRSDLTQVIESLLDRLLDDLRKDAELRVRLDAWARDTISHLVDQHHHVLGEIVAESLAQLKNEDLIEQVQEKVWSDLQYIRLNGAIVGGLVGIALATIKWLLA